jgi:DNA gyrase/topoisomerase IV subunit B
LEHTLESLLAAGRNGEMTADDLWEAVMTVDRSKWTREDYAELTELFYSLGGKRVANTQRAVWETVPYGRAHR